MQIVRSLRKREIPVTQTSKSKRRRRRSNETAQMATSCSQDAHVISTPAVNEGSGPGVVASQCVSQVVTADEGAALCVPNGSIEAVEGTQQEGLCSAREAAEVEEAQCRDDQQGAHCSAGGYEGDAPLSPMSTLQKAYDQLYEKYQKAKARNLEQVEKLLEDQRKRRTAYCKAADALVELVRKDNLWLQHQIEEARIHETLSRLKELEKENALYRNELLMARAKEYQSNTVNEDRHRFLQKLLQSWSQMQITEEDLNSTAFVFQHQSTGLKFVLEQVCDSDIAQLCGGDGEVKFRVISLGTLSNISPEWMREDLTFSLSQAPAFFRRIHGVANGRPTSM